MKLKRLSKEIEWSEREMIMNKMGIKYGLVPIWKRAFDIIGSSMLILLLAPVLMTIYIIIKFESPGPAIYTSKRVGQGFKIFPFYKFRSMYIDADKMVQEMVQENQYNSQFEEVVVNESVYNQSLICDDGVIKESEYQKMRIQSTRNTFFKVANDPRITKVGKFIRNTSLDELL